MKIFLFFIKLWRVLISPLLGCNCRYVPSCSLYMEQSLEQHGFFRGAYMGFLRICRCNSLFEGGHDPVRRKGQ
jgi:putative membrane protein insertion efficiency factor